MQHAAQSNVHKEKRTGMTWCMALPDPFLTCLCYCHMALLQKMGPVIYEVYWSMQWQHAYWSRSQPTLQWGSLAIDPLHYSHSHLGVYLLLLLCQVWVQGNSRSQLNVKKSQPSSLDTLDADINPETLVQTQLPSWHYQKEQLLKEALEFSKKKLGKRSKDSKNIETEDSYVRN